MVIAIMETHIMEILLTGTDIVSDPDVPKSDIVKSLMWYLFYAYVAWVHEDGQLLPKAVWASSPNLDIAKCI